MPDLTHEQQRAVHTTDRAIALLAGAGSGKTTVLVERYIELLRQRSSPRQILTVTFTTEAADQLRQRILRRLQDLGIRRPDILEGVETTPYIGTIHSFCYTLIETHGSVLGLKPIEQVIDTFELSALFDREYRFWIDSLPSTRLRDWLGYFTHGELRNLARQIYTNRFLFARSLKSPNVSTADRPEWVAQLFSDLQPLITSLESSTVAQGLYTFDDLENFVFKILEASPETVQTLQRDLKWVLVDEFQDTSRLQWQILRRIVGEDTRKLFIVGDPKQSIYSFRQADVGLFLRLARSLPQQGGELQELTVNFRSEPLLLEGINRLSQCFFDESLIPFRPMASPAAASPAQTPHEVVRVRRYPVTAKRSEAVEGEIQEVVAEVKELLSQGKAPSDIALLFRMSDRLGDYFAALTSAGIPATGTKTAILFRSYDVLDIANFLKAVANPLDDYALASFLRSSYVALTPWRLWDITQSSGDSLYEKCLVSNEPSLRWFCDLIESGEYRVGALLTALFSHGKYFPHACDAFLEFLSAINPDWNAAEACDKITAWEREEILYQTEQTAGSRQTVRLMTAHAAKGLEFPHVFLVDCLRQNARSSPLLRVHPDFFPGLKYRDPATQEMVTSPSYDKIEEHSWRQDLEEARRILYVAVTRAKQSLTLFLPADPKVAPRGSWGEWLEKALKNL